MMETTQGRALDPETAAGMAWWNSQTDRSRRAMLDTLAARGDTPTPARAWAVFGDGRSGPAACTQCQLKLT